MFIKHYNKVSQKLHLEQNIVSICNFVSSYVSFTLSLTFINTTLRFIISCKLQKEDLQGFLFSHFFKFLGFERKVTAETIRRPKITFYIGKELRQLLKDTPNVLGSLDMKGYKSRKSSEQENP